MSSGFRMAILFGFLSSACFAQTPMDVQSVKKLERTGTLGTCGYQPTEKEAPFYKRLDSSELVTGSSFTKAYSIQKKQDHYVSWFGIVRGIVDAKPDGATTLLLEQKFFDGMTDCHIMLVSLAGSGDFHATLGPIQESILPLTLVRIYGKVSGEKSGVPQVNVEYLRVWPWLTFTFMDMGPENKGNPQWAKYCRLCEGGRMYNPYPDKNYYLNVLGDPKEFGFTPTSDKYVENTNKFANSLVAAAQAAKQPEHSPLTATAAPQPAGGARGLVKYESKDPAVVLYKPEKWTVTPTRSATALHVKVAAPEGAARVEVYFADNRSTRFNSLSLLQSLSQQMKKNYPDLKLSEMLVCKDQAMSCAVAMINYTDGNVPVKGRYFCHADQNQAVIRSYQAPASELATQRLLLLDILANIHVLKSSSGGSGSLASAPLNVQFAQRRAADGSWTVKLPSDWNLTGQGGKVIAGAPGGGAGFLFTTFEVMPPLRYGVKTPPNVIVSRYQPPAEILHTIWEKFNNRDIRILGSKPDPQTAGACSGQIGKKCEAADVQLGWISAKGASCVGSFKVLNALPGVTGQWFSIVAGIWGPSNDLERYMPVLQEVGGSFSINDRFAQGYIQQGLTHLRELQAQTQRSIQGLYQAIDDNQRAYEQRVARKERSDAAWDDYNRGNSYWISDIEGGKVYATDPWGTKDTTTGDRLEGAPYDYISFEGQNPRYSSEYMREVNSYDLEHGTAPKP